jgi:hypothetical protein
MKQLALEALCFLSIAVFGYLALVVLFACF